MFGFEIPLAYQIVAGVAGGSAGLYASWKLAKDAIFWTPYQFEAVIERGGKFHRSAKSKKLPNIKIPYYDTVRATVDMKKQTLPLEVDIRTKAPERTLVTLPVTIMYYVQDSGKAHYTFTDLKQALEAVISNSIMTNASKMSIDDLYESRDTVKDALVGEISAKMQSYGLRLDDVLVQSPKLSDDVKRYFDDVVASQRRREIAVNDAEAYKTKAVVEGEAAGMGQARQRKEYAVGIAEVMKIYENANLSPEQAMALMVITNGQEAIREAANGKGSVIMGTVSPTEIADAMQKTISTIMALRPAANANSKLAGAVPEVAPGKAA
ncbi:MAG: hypothetical protein HY053_01420 [Proteobacteria bacterium]|nr:hypothetical protein [Pseudomonadota bacterium]